MSGLIQVSPNRVNVRGIAGSFRSPRDHAHFFNPMLESTWCEPRLLEQRLASPALGGVGWTVGGRNQVPRHCHLRGKAL